VIVDRASKPSQVKTTRDRLRSRRHFHPIDRWLSDGDEIVPGLQAIALEGSKTPGELALLLQATTLITGDLVRAHRAGSLMLLPDAKLSDRKLALDSVQRLAKLSQVDTVLVGDGWHIFHDGQVRLQELVNLAN
jgi:hypothetical protein